MEDIEGHREEDLDLTTVHVRRAIQGDVDSCAWIIEHFSPALLLQAKYRLRGEVRGFCDPEDLVQDVWAIVLPRFPRLEARNERWTPVLVKYLSTALLHRANRVLRDYLRGAKVWRRSDDDSLARLRSLTDGATKLPSRIDRENRRLEVEKALARLDEKDREILVLRGLEGIPNQRVGEALGLSPAAVSMRYKRALERLGKELPDSVFAELAPETQGKSVKDS